MAEGFNKLLQASELQRILKAVTKFEKTRTQKSLKLLR